MYQNCYPTSMPLNPFQPTVSFPTAVPMQQAQAPSYTPSQLRGRVVNRIEDVTPNDVSMDGTPSIFPLQDESAIYIKRWSSDGTIKTVKYVLENSEEVSEVTDRGQEIIDRLKDISDQIKKINQAAKRTKREEVDSNE